MLKGTSPYPALQSELLALLPIVKKKSLPVYRILIAWALVRHLGAVLPRDGVADAEWAKKVAATSGAWIREWFLRKHIAQAFQVLGADAEEAALDSSLVRICVTHVHHIQALETEIWGPLIHTIFRDKDVEFFLGVNTWQGREWLNKERLSKMLESMLLVLLVQSMGEDEIDWDDIALAHDVTKTLNEAAEGTSYDYGWMLSCIK